MTTFSKVVDAAVKLGLDIEAAGEAEREQTEPDRSSAIVVLLPALTTNLPRGSNDDPEPLHLTSRYYSDPDPASLPGLVELLQRLAETCAPFTAKVSGYGRLGDNDAAVAFVESADVQDLHDLLTGAVSSEADKFPSYLPHVTLFYGDEGDLEQVAADLPTEITFDRIALWNGDDHTLELDLTGTEEMGDVDESSQVTPDIDDEKSLLLAAAFDEAVGAVIAAGVSLPVVDSPEDLPAAIDYATRHPAARWYVEAQAAAAGVAAPWTDSVVASASPDDVDVEAACEVMHDAYEAAAAGAGWETNPESRKPWAEVPEANKETMRAAVRALLEWFAADADDSEDEDPDAGMELRGPGGVQAAGAFYIRARSQGQPVDDAVYTDLMSEAAALGMEHDPIVLSAVAWHEQGAVP